MIELKNPLGMVAPTIAFARDLLARLRSIPGVQRARRLADPRRPRPSPDRSIF
jgi:hypothetical protein